LPAAATEAAAEPLLGYCDGADGLEKVSLSAGRFVQLSVFSAACFLSGVNTTIFAPVWQYAELRFDVSERRVNRLANVWNLWRCAAKGCGLMD